MLKINGSFGTDKVTVLLSQSYYFCEKVTVVMKITVCLGRKLPFIQKLTVISKSCRFSAESYRFSIKLPLLDKVTVFHKNNVFMIKIVFFWMVDDSDVGDIVMMVYKI